MKRDMGSVKKSLALAMTGAMTLASAAGCGTSGPGSSPAGTLTDALEGSIRSAMRRQGMVGMSAVVVSGGRRVLAAGYGFADRSGRIPVTVDTLFPLASITKLFTATAVMPFFRTCRMRSFVRFAPSRSEYWVWRWRWTKSDGMPVGF